jgi:hypothetical protein
MDGYVQKYACDCNCHDGFCWIVRHPMILPSISYPSEAEANYILEQVRIAEDAFAVGRAQEANAIIKSIENDAYGEVDDK